MSLVVAKRAEGAVFIISDTKVTPAYHEKSLPTDGVIKTAILGSGLCVSFAGSLDAADEAVRTLSPSDVEMPVEKTIIDHFLRHHQGSSEAVDFALGFGHPAYRLVKIADGEAAFVDSLWLGDKDAFELYQNAMAEKCAVKFQARIRLGGNSLGHWEMQDAMTAVISSLHQKTVGGFVTRVGYVLNAQNVGLQDGFNYLDYFDGFTTSLDPSKAFPEIRFGTAADGAFNFYFMRGYRFDGSRVVAVYFPQGSFGLIFLPHRHGMLRPQIVRDSSERDFAKILQSSFGISIPAWPGRQYKITPGT